MSPAEKPPTIYPDGYLRCPRCKAYIGAKCTSKSARIEGGQPVGGPEPLDHPHAARKVRAGW